MRISVNYLWEISKKSIWEQGGSGFVNKQCGNFALFGDTAMFRSSKFEGSIWAQFYTLRQRSWGFPECKFWLSCAIVLLQVWLPFSLLLLTEWRKIFSIWVSCIWAIYLFISDPSVAPVIKLVDFLHNQTDLWTNGAEISLCLEIQRCSAVANLRVAFEHNFTRCDNGRGDSRNANSGSLARLFYCKCGCLFLCCCCLNGGRYSQYGYHASEQSIFL